MIAVHSGLRLGEIAQLAPGDIRQMDGVWGFVLREGDGQRLKSSAAARFVPMHQELISYGLLLHRDAAAKAKSPRLFQELAGKEREGQDPAGVISRFFSRYIAKLGEKQECLSRDNLSFHGFRHTFRSALDAVPGASPIQLNRLLGHQDDSTPAGYPLTPSPPVR